MLPVFDARHHALFRSSVALELVGHDDAMDIPQTFEQFAKEAFGCVLVSAALHQDVQNVAILIDRAPRIVELAVNGEIDLIQMPFVTPPRAVTPQIVGKFLTKLQAPLPDGFVADDHPTCY